jgi:hypothetical protein
MASPDSTTNHVLYDGARIKREMDDDGSSQMTSKQQHPFARRRAVL